MSLQQVNLLQEGLLPKKELLHESQLLYGWLGFTALLILLSAWDGVVLYSVERESADLNIKLNTISEAKEKLLATQQGGEKRLKEEIKALQEKRFAQNALVQVLTVDDQEGAMGNALLALSNSDFRDVWLEEIRVVPQGVYLKGNVAHAAAFPRYLQALAENERFQGQRFDTVDLRRHEKSNALAFELKSPNLSDGASDNL